MTAAQYMPGAAVTRIGSARRVSLVIACLLAAFGFVGGKLVVLALRAQGEMKVALAEPIGQSWSRPDIVDRNGRLIATDVAVYSLFADPRLVVDRDTAVERLSAQFPDLNAAELRHQLADKARRFLWIKRGLTPREAERAHALGLPGFSLKSEPRRVYPSGNLFGHVVGAVNVDNKGLGGLERFLDESGRSEPVLGPVRSLKAPLRLALDAGVQQALMDELEAARQRYTSPAAAGLVLDIESGEIVGSASLPAIDPSRPEELMDRRFADRLTSGVYELGSVFKLATIAMAVDSGQASLDTVYDVRKPLTIGRFTINDLHPVGRPLTVREVFLHSSNVGAGMMALEAGTERQKSFLSRLGLLQPMRTEAGVVAPPLQPERWERIETVTIAYGHGLAVAPLQFAAAAAALVNGGHLVTPTYLAGPHPVLAAARAPVVSAATSERLREILRLNVTSPVGTGKRAEAETDAYRIGGKTGTAEIPTRGGYNEHAVISSFLAVFPTDRPRYLTLVLLFEPHAAEGAKGVTAGLNAAPVTGRIVQRIAPLLGVLPRRIETGSVGFDGKSGAQ
ncbi:MAG: peptidoglycan D,D-transpeptidase FtsI family protein [Hyphomicrobiaceae bacterium]